MEDPKKQPSNNAIQFPEPNGNNSIEEYVFILGSSFDLCLEELKVVIKNLPHKIVLVNPPAVYLVFKEAPTIDLLTDSLAGVVKIAKVVGKEEAISNEVLANFLKPKSDNDKKIDFGISLYGKNTDFNTKDLLPKIKTILRKDGFLARYVEGKENMLTSVTVEKNRLKELIIVKDNEKYIVAETKNVQDFENWNRKDYGRPAPDPKHGMLPPKVARMMVNIGFEGESGKKENEEVLLDPFCGVGTVLMECLLTGRNAIGSDQSKEALDKSERNLEWIKNDPSKTIGDFKLIVSDATHISEKIAGETIDAIITEPYLGPILDTKSGISIAGEKLELEKLKRIIKGLEKLYIGCLKDWLKVLKRKGKIVIALPSFVFEGKEFRVKNVVDNREKLGYTLVSGPFQYSHPQAVVKRNIYVLQKL